MADDADPPGTPGETDAFIAELLEQEAPWTREERAAIVAWFRRAFPDKHLHLVQPGNLASMWEAMAEMAQERDEHCQAIDSLVPPSFAALVAAVRRTRLTRFYPFTSHECLQFADCPDDWDRSWEQRAPACIGYGPEGYVVLLEAAGTGVPGEPVTCTLTTRDPDEAAAEAEQLLAGWARSGRGE